MYIVSFLLIMMKGTFET